MLAGRRSFEERCWGTTGSEKHQEKNSDLVAAVKCTKTGTSEGADQGVSESLERICQINSRIKRVPGRLIRRRWIFHLLALKARTLSLMRRGRNCKQLACCLSRNVFSFNPAILTENEAGVFRTRPERNLASAKK